MYIRAYDTHLLVPLVRAVVSHALERIEVALPSRVGLLEGGQTDKRNNSSERKNEKQRGGWLGECVSGWEFCGLDTTAEGQ